MICLVWVDFPDTITLTMDDYFNFNFVSQNGLEILPEEYIHTSRWTIISNSHNLSPTCFTSRSLFICSTTGWGGVRLLNWFFNFAGCVCLVIYALGLAFDFIFIQVLITRLARPLHMFELFMIFFTVFFVKFIIIFFSISYLGFCSYDSYPAV